MKMKNMLIGGMSLALVACISIGGTLAYLSDNTGTVQNKFQMVTNGIRLDLAETADKGEGYTVYEATYVGDEVVKDDEVEAEKTLNANTASEIDGFLYEDIQPGASLKKKVQLSIGELDKTTVNSYVFAVVDNANSEEVMTLDINTTSWEAVATADDGARTLYAYVAKDDGVTTATDSDGKTYVKEHDDSLALNPIFTKVDVADDAEAGVAMSDVRVSGYAYQADNVTFEEAKTAAMQAFGFAVAAE